MDSNNERQGEPKAKIWWTVAAIVCIVICVLGFCLVNYFAPHFVNTKDGSWAPSLFGDSFGAVNALISALAFAGLIVTFRFQQYELSLQREELKAQRNEFSTQNGTLRLQRFENTFFHMMELQQSIVNDLYAKENERERVRSSNMDSVEDQEVIVQDEYRGRNLFYYAFLRCEHTIEGKTVYGLRGVITNKGLSAFDDYYTTTVFDHYFRHLYTILKFIDTNEWLGAYEQHKYATIVRATLSRYELVMLYYDGLFYPKMKRLIEEYCMLNNIRFDLLTLSRENRVYSDGLGITTVQDIPKSGFSGTDFEFHLAETGENKSKYALSAFYGEDEMLKGREHLEQWNSFINNLVNVEKA